MSDLICSVQMDSTESQMLNNKYCKPTLTKLGEVATLTLGQNGSSVDGDCSKTQTGGGNDPTGPQKCYK